MAVRPVALSIINDTTGIIPSPAEIEMILADLGDLMNSRRIFGLIAIAGGGAGVFKVLEPGAEETTKVETIEGIIVMSHDVNVRWGHAYENRGKNERPACKAMDGTTGVDENGEIHDCVTCQYNQYADEGVRKACMNKRQLYILRSGDIVPVLFALPPSALRAFANYRINLSVSMRKRINGVVTRITLVTKKNPKDVEYSAPVFEAIAEIPMAEAVRIAQYTDGIVRSAQKAGIAADDFVPDETRDDGFDAASAAIAAAMGAGKAAKTDNQSGFVVCDEDVPEFGKS